MKSYGLWMRVFAVALLVGLVAGCTPVQVSKLERANQILTSERDAALQDLTREQQARKQAEAGLADQKRLLEIAQADAKRWEDMFKVLEKSKVVQIPKITVGRVGEDITIVERPGGPAMLIPSDILFDSGKAELKPQALATVKRVAQELKRLKNQILMIRVEGHTDSQPIVKSDWPDNWVLSAHRAHAVLKALEKEGVDRKMMYLAGFGYNRPINTNDTAAGRQSNRRVEILMVPKAP